MKYERTYNIKLKYTAGVSDPSKIFISYSNMINSFRKMNTVLSKSIYYTTNCKQILEDIQLGSISSKIKELFDCPDDNLTTTTEEITSNDIDEYFSYGTSVILETLSSGEKIDTLEKIEKIKEKINEKAKSSSIGQIISYTPPATNDIIDVIKNISEGVQSLTENEILEYQKDNVVIEIPKKIDLDVQKIEAEMSKKFITTQRELILKIKTLNFIGTAKWGFKHGTKNIDAKIEDNDWNDEFYIKKNITLYPGYSLQVLVEILEEYDKTGKLIKEEFTITKVIQVIPGSVDDD